MLAMIWSFDARPRRKIVNLEEVIVDVIIFITNVTDLFPNHIDDYSSDTLRTVFLGVDLLYRLTAKIDVKSSLIFL
jgi:hypothetical protein